MLRYFANQKWVVLFFIVLIISDPLLTSKLNFLARDLFDNVGAGAAKNTILIIFLYLFCLWILKRVITFVENVVQAYLIKKIKIDLKHRLFCGIMKLDIYDFTNKDSGDYISLFTNDVNILENKYFNSLIGLLFDISSIVILGASFFVLEKTIASTILVIGIISMMVPVFFQKYTSEKSLKYSKAIGLFTQKIKEFFMAYPTIKNYAVENKIIERFEDENNATENAKFEAEYALSLANALGAFFAWFMQFVSVGTGIFLVMNGKTTIGTVIAAQSFASDLGSPLQTFVLKLNSIRSVKTIISGMRTFLEVNNAGSQKESQIEHYQNAKIQFNNVNLKIGETTIIDDFSFNFMPSKKYLVLGRNGSGKSTLFKLLKKSFGNYSGRIQIGDADIKTMSDNQISKYVSYMRENVSLLSGTVKENIMLYRDCSEDDLSRAIEQTQVNITIERDIQDGGLNISSGEQRRIEIARSLLNSAKILVFDEVVSTLDIETAYEIEKLALSFDDKTIIFISHNFSGKLIKEYDEILIMHAGTLVAHGSYDELIKSDAYFQRICDIKLGQRKILNTQQSEFWIHSF